MSVEKRDDMIAPAADQSSDSIDLSKSGSEDLEIFKREEGAVDFRTVSWVHTSVIFLKSMFDGGSKF